VKKNLTFILHIHPEKVPKASIRYTYTYGLGGMILVLIILQILTGILLKFVYEPSPEKAYDSILFLQNHILFGQYVRNIHHMGGVLLIIIVFLHLLRVFFTEAFHGPVRRGNWIIGICLLLLIMFSNFTGYLLPWDQLSYWAITVITNMFKYIPLIGESVTGFIRGGKEVGSSTLLNFFNFHTAVSPLAILVLMVFHFWKVRKAGGVAIPRKRKDSEQGVVPAVPDLAVRELAVGLTLLAVVFFLSIFLDAPLRERANPAYSPNPAKAPWYFMGIQELIMHFHPFIAVVLLPATILGLLIYLPYFHYKKNKMGFWFSSPKGRKMVGVSALIALVITPLLIVTDEYWIHFNQWLPRFPAIVSEGLFPLILYGILFYGYLVFLRKKYQPVNNETVQAVFVFFLITYTVLSITGILFRGPGMMLMWPWQTGT